MLIVAEAQEVEDDDGDINPRVFIHYQGKDKKAAQAAYDKALAAHPAKERSWIGKELLKIFEEPGPFVVVHEDDMDGDGDEDDENEGECEGGLKAQSFDTEQVALGFKAKILKQYKKSERGTIEASIKILQLTAPA